MTQDQPQTPIAKKLKLAKTPQRWQQLVTDAKRRCEVVEKVEAEVDKGTLSRRKSLETIAPDDNWSSYLHWRRRYEAREGPGWERLLDERLPSPAPAISDTIRQAACMLRRVDRSIGPDKAQEHLVAQFGQEGRVSPASLRRIWAEADLGYEPPKDGRGQRPGEKVVHYNGGGGIALLGAAEVEVKSCEKLAEAVLEAGRRHADEQGEVEAKVEAAEVRNERGQFTAAYNTMWRRGLSPGEVDSRWASDEQKREQRVLSELPTLAHRTETLAAKLLCMGVMPQLTERWGFVGLEGPAGQWLELLGTHAYMPATLDKTLTELGLLDVNEALWSTHAAKWNEQSQSWSEGAERWLRWAVYIDATQDPYWTRHYALSGKVSRVGRVMPCLSRVAVTSGPGVPLVVETWAGTASLKKRLVPLLEQLEQWVGEGELGRMTVFDSEMATAGLLWAVHERLDKMFITVLKGKVLAGAERSEVGDWQPYRERDQLRELSVTLQGQGAPKAGVCFRAVEMERKDSRRAHRTLFATNSVIEDVPTEEVASCYLSRWPHQEQVFRDGRNGGGGDRSHGYGGRYITHVAFRTKIEEAEGRLWRAEDRLAEAQDILSTVAKADPGNDEESAACHIETVKAAKKRAVEAEQAEHRARGELIKRCTMPREIYARDTGRDNLMTCLKLNCLLLLEFVLKEYFGGLRMEWRTFIEQFNFLAVTVRSTRHRILYQVHANGRQPARMEQLRVACKEVSRRDLRRDGKLLRFELLPPDETGSTPMIGGP